MTTVEAIRPGTTYVRTKAELQGWEGRVVSGLRLTASGMGTVPSGEIGLVVGQLRGLWEVGFSRPGSLFIYALAREDQVEIVDVRPPTQRGPVELRIVREAEEPTLLGELGRIADALEGIQAELKRR